MEYKEIVKNIFSKIEPFRYGFYDQKLNKLIYQDDFDDYSAKTTDKKQRDDCRILTPEEVVQYKAGTCWDVSLYTYKELKQLGFTPTAIFYIRDNFKSCHSTICCKFNGKLKLVDYLTPDTMTKEFYNLDDVIDYCKNDNKGGTVESINISVNYDKCLSLGTKLTFGKYLDIVTKRLINLK